LPESYWAITENLFNLFVYIFFVLRCNFVHFILWIIYCKAICVVEVCFLSSILVTGRYCYNYVTGDAPSFILVFCILKILFATLNDQGLEFIEVQQCFWLTSIIDIMLVVVCHLLVLSVQIFVGVALVCSIVCAILHWHHLQTWMWHAEFTC
jgi:hypothetical protein